MKTTTVCILGGSAGVIFAVILRHINMSPAQYVFKNYGIGGLIIYAVVALICCGYIILYLGRKRSERCKELEAKE